MVTLGLFGHDRPAQLFRENPVARDLPAGSALWHQTVLPRTVTRAETISIAGVGRLQLWVASSRQHGVCSAIRLPNGDWAGLGVSRMDEGGSVPGCHPTRQQINRSGSPVYAIDGFDYEETLVRGHDGRSWRIEYGTINPPHGRARRVRDALSGITASVADGRWFAIVFPIHHPQAMPLAPRGAQRHRPRDRRRAIQHLMDDTRSQLPAVARPNAAHPVTAPAAASSMPNPASSAPGFERCFLDQAVRVYARRLTSGQPTLASGHMV